MSDNYTTRTASLRAVAANVSDLDAKRINATKINATKITVDGKDISEMGGGIKSAKHFNDTRQTITEKDLWGQYTEIIDGQLVIHDEYIETNCLPSFDSTITEVVDNKAYKNGTLVANIQTDRITNGDGLFFQSNMTRFVSKLSSLEIGENMFEENHNLTKWSIDLPKLHKGDYMFSQADKLSSFEADLHSLVHGGSMFWNCSNLTSFESNVNSLIYGDSMFYCCTSLPNFCKAEYSYSADLSQFNNDLKHLKFGNYMFCGCSNLTTFDSSLDNLEVGDYMFNFCTTLKEFENDMRNLKRGAQMFYYCTDLSSFNSDLRSLEMGQNMFSSCNNLSSFNSDLRSLKDGHCMFESCYNLIDFTNDLPQIKHGKFMFYSCNNLTSFIGDMSSLVDANYMYSGCKNLTQFVSDLSSLIGGYYMFNACKLSSKSVKNIINTINDLVVEKSLYTSGQKQYVTSSSGKDGFASNGDYYYEIYKFYGSKIFSSEVGKITIGIDVTNNSSTVQQQLATFANEVGYNSWAELKQAFVDKGWTVTWQYGRTTTSITYDMRGERAIPCSIYARLVEIIPQGEEYSKKEKKQAEYCNEDGTKFYNIEWGHDVTNTEDYQQFDSIQDAAVAFGVFKKEFLY